METMQLDAEYAEATRLALAELFGFNPDQRRGPDGRWVSMGGRGSAGKSAPARGRAPRARRANAAARQQRALAALPPVKTFSKSAAGRDGWLTTDDPAVRASTIWADTVGGLRAVRQASKNLRAGRDPLDGVDLDAPDVKRIWARKRDKKGYSRDDFGADVIRAAAWLNDQQDKAPVRDVLFRGMRVERDKLPKVGDEVPAGPMSWSNGEVAGSYANWPHSFETGVTDYAREHWAPTYFVVRGLPAVDVGSHVTGKVADQEEYVSEAPLRVVSVETYDHKNPRHPKRYSWDEGNPPMVVTVEAR